MEIKRISTKQLLTLGILLAMEIILSRFFSISAWNMKIGFNFVPIAVAAILFGPIAGGTVAALGDFVGAILFPIGAYFPGFTLTAFLDGIILGAFLHRKQTVVRVLSAVAANQLVLGLLINTLWISILYGCSYTVLLTTRILQCAVLLPVQFLTISTMTPVLVRYERRIAG